MTVSIQNLAAIPLFDDPTPIAQLCLRRVTHAIGMSQFRGMCVTISGARIVAIGLLVLKRRPSVEGVRRGRETRAERTHQISGI